MVGVSLPAAGLFGGGVGVGGNPCRGGGGGGGGGGGWGGGSPSPSLLSGGGGGGGGAILAPWWSEISEQPLQAQKALRTN